MEQFITYQSAKAYFTRLGHFVALKDQSSQTVIFDNETWSLPAFLTMAEESINA